MEAEIVKGLLEVNGIQVMLIAGNDFLIGTGSGGTRNVKVLVREEDAQDAFRLIGQPAQTSHSMSDLTAFVANELGQGKDHQAIARQLVERGWPEASAQHLVKRRAQQQSVQQRECDAAKPAIANAYFRRMIRSLFLLIGGMALTVLTYQLASSTGGMYVIWGGAIIWGLIDFVVGLGGRLENR